jgi:alkaline phosphatase
MSVGVFMIHHVIRASFIKIDLLKVIWGGLFLVGYVTQPEAQAEDASTWVKKGEAALAAAKRLTPNNKPAKNVILFVGDGMGISTITAARIFQGQSKGMDGESNQLSFEKLPYVALSKTYSANQQTADSAPTMTAMVTGVKTNDGIFIA